MDPATRPRRLTSYANDPFTQNIAAGIGIAFSAGVFVSLNLLGAGGGRPESAHIIQIANAILSSVWFLSACIGGTYLNLLGPGVTMCFGICTYALYVGSLWYYESTGQETFPLVGGAVIGVGAGAVFITSGYIQVVYSSDENKGKFIAVQNSLQAGGSIICSILPVVLNRENASRSGVPAAVYIAYIAVMLGVAMLSLVALRRPAELKKAVPEASGLPKKKSFSAELRVNLAVFKDWKLLVLLPAFLPAGSFLIYLGSINAFENNLRARSLLSFIALVVQIPLGHVLHLILDYRKWSRRRRGLTGLCFVAVPLCVAWIWEIIRTRNLNRASPPEHPVDWTEPRYGPAMVLFVMNSTASILWQYLVPWFIGNLDIPEEKISHYMGVQRGFLAAGEAICFGVDAAKIPYVAFAGAIFAFYAVGIAALAYMGSCHLTASSRAQPEMGVFGEDGACGGEEEKDEALSAIGTNSTGTKQSCHVQV
ncbi:hypothetical protein AB5N19_04244 [Seiridium cardinale]